VAKRIEVDPTRRDGNCVERSVPCLARGFRTGSSGPSPNNVADRRAGAGGWEGGEFDLNRTEKEQVIGELHEKMAKAKAAIVAEPRGLTVAVVTDLRKKLRDAKVEYRVVKNTLAARAAKGTPLESVADKFVGPTAIVMSYDDVVVPAKMLADFMKDRENFAIRTAVVEGKVIDAKGVQALAKMPGLQELRGQIAAMIAQPATKLARMIGTPGQQLARVLGARREQLEKQG
jgi:large subunit ribosomal protein L10